jgi:dipeptidyl aminopeptidase/acylaminoacyl peptidase
VLISQESSTTNRTEIWLLPLAARPNADAAARKIASDPAYDLYQSRFSPDGRWVAFGALRSQPAGVQSAVYVIPATGGQWIPVTQGKHWDDKPRWSPDGKTIYFISSRNGFLNVWGVRFDPEKGLPVGEPFQVTTFSSPGLMIPDQITRVGLSLNQEKLALTLEERSGSIWVLDNVGQ